MMEAGDCLIVFVSYFFRTEKKYYDSLCKNHYYYFCLCSGFFSPNTPADSQVLMYKNGRFPPFDVSRRLSYVGMVLTKTGSFDYIYLRICYWAFEIRRR